MTGLRLWLTLAYQPFGQLVPLARAAEAAGFHGVTVAEHLATPATITSRYPYRDDGVLDVTPDLVAPDPLVTVSVLAAATSRLRVATTVYLLPLHELFSAAKSVATAACFAGDRLVFGVGVGWMREEFDLTGHPFAGRGRRADEMLAALGALLGGGMVEHHGEFYDFGPVQIAPVPAAPVPVVVGGESDAALERAARADGWVGGRAYETAHLAQLLDRFRAARHRLRPDAPEPIVITSLPGPPEPAELEALRTLGVTDVVVRARLALGSARASLDERLATLDAFAARYLSP